MTTSTKRRRTSIEPTSAPEQPKPTPQDAPTTREEPVAKQAKKVHNTSTEDNLQALGDMYQYKSNIFKMEMKEMLAEVGVNYKKRMASAEKILHLLKGVIDAIPERMEVTVEAAEKEMKKRKVHIPYPAPRPTAAVQYKFAYQKPSYINVVGSYALKTLIKQQEDVAIDLVLTMPGDIFQEKDYINYRYFHKRAYYLAVLAASIAGDKATKKLKLSYEYMNGDHLRPILVVSSANDGSEADFKSSKCTIRIIPSAPAGQFPARKLAPSKCGIRNTQGLEGGAEQSFDATPFYNSSVAADGTYFPYLALLGSSSRECEAFTDACVFGRVWLRQRGFGGSISKGGFGHFEWAILMAFLLQAGGPKGRPLLTPGYSDYQLFKATLQFLASKNLANSPLIINGPAELERVDSSMPVVYDGEHGVNVLFKMTASSYELLKHEAAMTLECLSKSTLTNQFDAVFLYRIDNPCYRYDAIAQIPVPTNDQLTALGQDSRFDDRSSLTRYTHKIYNTLKQGLGDRQVGVFVSCFQSEALQINGSSIPQDNGPISIGLLFDEKNLDRKTDRGPSPEEKKKAAAFRKFWGEIAELRRFPDGTIVESVNWQTKGTKTPIYQQIVGYLIKHHFGVEAVRFSEKPMDHLIQGSRQGNAPFQPILSAYDILENDLKALTKLPLSMRHISPTGSQLRYSSVEIPLDSGTKLSNPVDVIIQFESSGRWPDDMSAIQKIKTSFLIKTGELLEEHKAHEIIARVGLENEASPLMNSSFLDVVYTSTGAAFRLRIHHDREPALLGRMIVDPESTPKERDATMFALAAHRRTFTLLPRHTGLIRKLCMRFSSLSSAIRLTKKWFHVHMLSPHVPQELIEILVTRTYLLSYPWSTPTTVLTGFLRTLQFISTWDWTADPLILDMSEGDLKTPEYDHIQQVFQATRKKDPAMHTLAMFVATNYDQEDSLWTERKPTRVVAGRITALTKIAVQALGSVPCEIDISKIFTPSSRDYNFLLHLNPRFTPTSRQTKHSKPTVSKFKNIALDSAPIEGMSVNEDDIENTLDVDLVRDFVDEISEIYKDSLVLFRDEVAGTVVGGVWCPHTVKAWKPYLGYSTIPQLKKGEEGKKVETVLNKNAVLNEIARIGGDLVAKVEVIEK